MRFRRAVAAGLAACAAATGLLFTPAVRADNPRGGAAEPDTGRVIVKYRDGSVLLRGPNAAVLPRPLHADVLSRRTGWALEDRHVLGPRMQSLVVRERGVSAAQLARRLAADPDVEWAQPVRRKWAASVVPNDPLFGAGGAAPQPAVGQWFLRAPDAVAVSAIDAQGAWAGTWGSSGVVVAVLDTGVRGDHPDLRGKLLPGYDFISRTGNSADGDGSDADPSDPGDFNDTATSTCPVDNSSWHGTQVSGLIGAATHNGTGIAGAGRNVMVLPVRVLGRCGGYDDDIIAGMRWAGGISSFPSRNPFPARVLNMSLGADGACDAGARPGTGAYSTAIAELAAAGVVVVAAAGNGNSRGGIGVGEPANCPGAIGVAGLRHTGTKVGYSNLGPEIAIAAPAGNCVNTGAGQPCLYPLVTTTNAGTTTPGANVYSDDGTRVGASIGTSFAAPLVSGTVGLMLSVNPGLSPAQVRAALQSSARAFPAAPAGVATCVAGTSASPQLECGCTRSTCGAGLLSAAGAVAAVVPAAGLPPLVNVAVSNATPAAGTRVTLSAAASPAPGVGVTSIVWRLLTGSALAGWVGDPAGAEVVLETRAGGDLIAEAVVTDARGGVTRTSVALAIQGPPPSGGGGGGGDSGPGSGGSGGGAMDAHWLLGLAVATVLLLSPAGAASASRGGPRGRARGRG